MLYLDIVHESRSVDATAEYLRNKDYRLDLTGRGGADEFRARVSARYQDRFFIGEIEYGAAAHVWTPAGETGFSVSLPLKGSARAATSDGDLACNTTRGVVSSPMAPLSFETAADTKRLTVSFVRDAVHAHFARMTGEPVIGDIAFDPELDLTGAVGRTILAAVDLFAGWPDHDRPCRAGTGVADGEARAAAFEDCVLSALLLYHPHSHADRVAPSPAKPASRDVKRAIDYIQANLGEAIRLDDLIAVANVPGRTLNEHFRAFTGLSPLAYVRRERLKQARRILTSDPEISVTDTAVLCGITHLGRFSIDYARAFGEAPSHTARITRGRRAFS